MSEQRPYNPPEVHAPEKILMPISNARELEIVVTGTCFFCFKPSEFVFLNKKEYVELCAKHCESVVP